MSIILQNCILLLLLTAFGFKTVVAQFYESDTGDHEIRMLPEDENLIIRCPSSDESVNLKIYYLDGTTAIAPNINTKSISILHFGKKHAGRYVCYTMKNDKFEVLKTFELYLLAEQHINSYVDIDRSKPFVASIGESIFLNCTGKVKKNDKYQLYWNFKTLDSASERVTSQIYEYRTLTSIYITNKLHINNIVHDDAGSYTCVLKSEEDGNTFEKTDAVQLTVEDEQ